MIRCNICGDKKPESTMNINGECESCSEICEMCFKSTYYVGDVNSNKVCDKCAKLSEVNQFIGQKLIRIEFQKDTNNPIYVFESGAIIAIPVIPFGGKMINKYELKKLVSEKPKTKPLNDYRKAGIISIGEKE